MQEDEHAGDLFSVIVFYVSLRYPSILMLRFSILVGDWVPSGYSFVAVVLVP